MLTINTGTSLRLLEAFLRWGSGFVVRWAACDMRALPVACEHCMAHGGPASFFQVSIIEYVKSAKRGLFMFLSVSAFLEDFAH